MSIHTFARRAALAGSVISATILVGCGDVSSLFYQNHHQQAIQRDTIGPGGQVHSTTQDPQFRDNGVVHLAPVESLGLVPVTVEVPTGELPSVLMSPRTLMVPPGFTAKVIAINQGAPYGIVVRDDGVVFFTDMKGGRLVAMKPDGTTTDLATDLESPTGLELVDGALYYTDEHHVYRFDFDNASGLSGHPTVLNDHLPDGGDHPARMIRWAPAEKKFYIGVGSDCNACEEADPNYATVMRMPQEGGTVARAMLGLRYVSAMDVNPLSGDLWGIDNGTDDIALDLPPEEVNVLKVGHNYGWPYYYGDNYRDPRYMQDTAQYPARRRMEAPAIELQAHSEALDMHFYRSSALGSDWKNAAIITFHGSTKREPPAGYKVVRLRADADGSNARQADFITGFLTAEGDAWARPTGIAIAGDGRSFYITDDEHGSIIRVTAP